MRKWNCFPISTYCDSTFQKFDQLSIFQVLRIQLDIPQLFLEYWFSNYSYKHSEVEMIFINQKVQNSFAKSFAYMTRIYVMKLSWNSRIDTFISNWRLIWMKKKTEARIYEMWVMRPLQGIIHYNCVNRLKIWNLDNLEGIGTFLNFFFISNFAG